MKSLLKKSIAEFIGTFVLVFVGCLAAVITGNDVLAIACAFGLSIAIMVYVIGKISGCHINPAVTIAMLIKGAIKVKDAICYIVSQILGGIAGAGMVFYTMKTLGVGLLQKSYEEYYGAAGSLPEEAITEFLKQVGANTLISDKLIIPTIIFEVILTFIFVLTVCRVASDKKYSKVAGIVIGLALTAVHIIGIQFTGTSVNPARSIGPAIFAGEEALKQVWIFIVAPIVGGILAALVDRYVLSENGLVEKETLKNIDINE